MSYAIVKVIYGVPLTEDCIDLINKWESDPSDERWYEDDCGTCGFESLYSASGSGSGYCGVELDTLDSYENQPVSKVRMTPTAKEKKEAEEMVENLHPELRKRAGKIDVYFVWGDS